jgi:hypothetical protein
MIDHFLVKIDRDNKKWSWICRNYRNVPLRVIRFHSQFTKKSEMLNLHSHIYMSKFQFKQFSIEQSRCAMKMELCIIGAWTPITNNPFSILDIGTGTGSLH